MPNSGKTTRTIIVAISAMFIVTMVVFAYVIRVAGPDASMAIMANVFLNLGSIAAVLVNLRVTSKVAMDTDQLRNGLLDAKVRAATAEVLPDHLVDPHYREDQLAVDMVRREAARDGEGPP